jgi:hypothetical protein
MRFRYVVEEYDARYDADDGKGGKQCQCGGFGEVVWRIENFIGYDDHEEVADDHIDDSAHVYARSEEAWVTNDGKWCGKEAKIPAEMDEKTKYDSIRSVAIEPPVSITHSPHEETEKL